MDRAFPMLAIPERSNKPRSVGLTMVADGLASGSLGLHQVDDLMQAAGPYIDLVKLVALEPALQSRDFVQKKIALYRKHSVEVFPGGMLLEAALAQGRVDECLAEMVGLGFTAVEISDSVSVLTCSQKVRLVHRVNAHGARAIVELGKKSGQLAFQPDVAVPEINSYLEAGAWRIILEGEVVTSMVGASADERVEAGASALTSIATAVGAEHILFEIPLGLSFPQLIPTVWWFVERFGPEVNLANVDPAEVMAVEFTRRGFAPQGWGEIPLGNV